MDRGAANRSERCRFKRMPALYHDLSRLMVVEMVVIVFASKEVVGKSAHCLSRCGDEVVVADGRMGHLNILRRALPLAGCFFVMICIGPFLLLAARVVLAGNA